MGPPKKKQYRVPFGELHRRLHYFEYRWHAMEGHYYFFCPYTGETIMNAELELIDRSCSMWGKAELETVINQDAYGILLLPPVHASRTWGVRRFIPGFGGDRDAAARHMQTVFRGHMARLALRNYFKQRYYTLLCPFTHYYYFFDTHNPKAETSWYKPSLVSPGVIQPYVAFDPTDNMPNPGDKYQWRGFVRGPYLKQSKLGKGNTERAPQDAFQIIDPRRPLALRTNEEIDLEKYPLGTVVLWMDGLSLQTLDISDYVAVRASICGGDWGRTLTFMQENWSRPLTRIYCWHSFSKTEVPMDGKFLTAEAKEVLNLCRTCLEDRKHEFRTTEKVFMAQALASIFSERASRLEYFNANYVMEQGEARAKAVDEFNAARASAFNKYLRRVPTEEVKASIKGSKDFYTERLPVQRSMELIEGVLSLLGLLAHDSEVKEVMAHNLAESVFYAIKVCRENPTLVMTGLKLLYNMTYRCESGQESIHRQDVLGLLRNARHYHSADEQVAYQTRRLELALYENGWRGNVEMMLEKELRGERLPKKLTRKAPNERPYPEDFKMPLEIAEEERLAAIELERLEQAAVDAEYAEELMRSQSHAGEKKSSRGDDDDDVRDIAVGSKPVPTDPLLDPQTSTLSNAEDGDILGALDQLRSSLGELRGAYRAEDKSARDATEHKRRGHDSKESKGMRDFRDGDDEQSVSSELTHDDAGHW